MHSIFPCYLDNASSKAGGAAPSKSGVAGPNPSKSGLQTKFSPAVANQPPPSKPISGSTNKSATSSTGAKFGFCKPR